MLYGNDTIHNNGRGVIQLITTQSKYHLYIKLHTTLKEGDRLMWLILLS